MIDTDNVITVLRINAKYAMLRASTAVKHHDKGKSERFNGVMVSAFITHVHG